MLASIPSELSLGWIYFPPILFAILLGLGGALVIAKLLSATALNRVFWHPGLAFVAMWVLLTSLFGLFLIPT